MSSVLPFSEPNPAQESFIINISSNPLLSLGDIKQEYEKIYGPIRADAIQKLQLKNKKAIDAKRKAFLNTAEFESIPVANVKVRLWVYEQVIKNGLTKKPVRKIPPMSETDEPILIEDMDSSSVIAALKAIKEELHGIKKLQIDNARATGQQSPKLEENNFPRILLGLDDIDDGDEEELFSDAG